MKTLRYTALLLGVLLFIPKITPAAAASGVTLQEQYASELSRYTGLCYYRLENTQRYMDYKALHPECTPETVMTYVNIGLDRPFYTHADVIPNPGDAGVLVNKYHILPADFKPPTLKQLNSLYSIGALYLTPAAQAAFDRLCTDAKALGYRLYATSAYRSYERQAEIYASFLLPGKENLAASQDLLAARPGFSEHQTGLAVDVIHAKVPSNEDLVKAPVYQWYTRNAHQYGFIIRYPEKCDSITGYAFEPWHLRYLGVELATAVYNSGLTYEEYAARGFGSTAQGPAYVSIGVASTGDIAADSRVFTIPACRIRGSTYFRLRDVAAVLRDTDHCFDVAYDSRTMIIGLQPELPYSAGSYMPGQLTAAGLAMNMSAVPLTLECGGMQCDLGIYMHDNTAYIRLEELAVLLGWTLVYDAVGTPVIMSAETPADISAASAAP
jgi:D-alanyl-D-alanine carboxypeptidase